MIFYKKQQSVRRSRLTRYFCSAKILVLLFGLLAIISSKCRGNELSLNGIVPVVGNANGYGWTAGAPIGGFMTGDDVDLYAGYWEPPISQNGNLPQIATNALIFPEAGSVIHASSPTNIIWHVDKITDDIDGTNLTITSITLHYADTTNFILEVTNNIANTLGEIEWYVPPGSWAGATNYVLKFEVIDSSFLTNSRVFWDNEFTIVPEMGTVIGYLLLILGIWRKFKT